MSGFLISKGDFTGWRLRVLDGKTEAKSTDEDDIWKRAPLRALAKAYPVGEEPWPWLLEQGIRRPQPSGKSGAPKKNAAMRAEGKKRIEIWLTPDEVAALEEKRKGRSVRDTIGALLLKK